MANEAINMQAATIITVPDTGLSSGGSAMPIAAKIKSQIACHMAPYRSGKRRP